MHIANINKLLNLQDINIVKISDVYKNTAEITLEPPNIYKVVISYIVTFFRDYSKVHKKWIQGISLQFKRSNRQAYIYSLII